MDTYKQSSVQDPLYTRNYWTDLLDNEESQDVLSLSYSQIQQAQNEMIITAAEESTLSKRKRERTVQIRQESVKRYPVQVPEKSAQQTFSERYENKMTDSKRKRKRHMLGTELHRKKLNAKDVQSAETKHQNERDSRLETIMQKMQATRGYLNGHSADEIMSGADISYLAEFLVDDESKMMDNINILVPERFEAAGWEECVRQFKELDLSADLRTDKAVAKDADRLEKIKGKTMAMIRLVNEHPEIEESMSPVEREEFEGKLDRAYAIVDYYQLRKDIITDRYYRTHENSEISMRFEKMPEDLAQQFRQEQNARAAAAPEDRNPLTGLELTALPYYRRQNLTRKIWDAEQRASTMGQFIDRNPEVAGWVTEFYLPLSLNVEQKDPPEYADTWKTYVEDKLSPVNIRRPHQFPPRDTTSDKGKYLVEHDRKGDPVFEAVTKKHFFAGTEDLLPEWSREFGLANWDGLKTLSYDDFKTMMENAKAFNVKVDAQTPASDVKTIRDKQLAALSTYKQMLLRETEFLKEKYGCGLRLETPFSIAEHYAELWKDLGNAQTHTMMFKYLKKYGIMDEGDPADLDMELTFDSIYLSFSTAISSVNVEFKDSMDRGKLPSYADVMRKYTVRYQEYGINFDKSELMRIKEKEREFGSVPMVRWGLKPPYANA